ncbi:MAG: hypothetical protein QOD84_2191 [Acidobacteriaceae bacterium]|jgi:hypothetical protein
MRLWLTILALILSTSLFASGKKSESLQELKARAQAAKAGDQASLYIELAERELTAATELYHQGKIEQGRSAVDAIVSYSQKAHDASAESNKKLKNTEIAFRKMALKLRDLKQTLNFEDQAPVQAAGDHLESLRMDLLSHLFPKAPK